jgi:hypothetical protein
MQPSAPPAHPAGAGEPPAVGQGLTTRDKHIELKEKRTY